MRSKILILLFFFAACNPKKQHKEHKTIKQVQQQELQTSIDTNHVKGAILIFDSNKNTYYSNDFAIAQKSVIPASTYKIPHSIIGLETGILENENSVFEWDGKERAMKVWEKDLTLKQAFQLSCVPCYQGLARKIGPERMNEYLNELEYGQMDVNDETIDNFWLIGNSKISPFQQIDFLKRLYNQTLPISTSTHKTLIEILTIEENKNYTLSGKTGLAIHPNGDIGWFVGYLEKDDNVIYFATRISPDESGMPRNQFIALRKSISFSALETLGFMESTDNH